MDTGLHPGELNGQRDVNTQLLGNSCTVTDSVSPYPETSP
jgi:hypothetical protein